MKAPSHFGVHFHQKEWFQKQVVFGILLRGASGRFLGASARFLVQTVSEKGAEITSKRIQKGVKNRVHKKHEKHNFDMLFATFRPCRASKKKLRSLGYEGEVETKVQKKTPSKHILGGSDGRLGPPRAIFWSPLGPPFGDKIQKK